MTDELEHPAPPSRSLLDRPQPLGILPTRWFWTDRKNRRLAGWLFGALVFMMLVMLNAFALHPVLDAVIIAAVLLVARGLLEKYVRHKALQRRRALAESVTREALPGD
ncbi:MAG: hypothetical protein R6X02_29890 [Enhygromyxa sp.]